jgi:penicillin-binding protein 1C
LLADVDARGVREKFLAGQLPPAETPSDYDAAGNVQLGPEYTDWFRSAENSVRDRAVLVAAGDALQITSPLPGSVYVVDPDVPSTRKIPLLANGGTEMEWRSESLRCASEASGDFALAADGEHRILVTDRVSGRQAETWIRIRSL